jgi:hypothetical protein
MAATTTEVYIATYTATMFILQSFITSLWHASVDAAAMIFLRSILLFHSFTFLWNAIGAAPYEGQTQLTPEGPDDWQKYVRSPSSPIVYPARIVASYTQGNVTNPEGLLTGKGSTLFTRNAPTNATSPDIPPTIVVDFGQNIAGYLSVSFGVSYNSTPGRPGIRLAFSETLEYLTDFSDFSRGYNVRAQSISKVSRLMLTGRCNYSRKRSGTRGEQRWKSFAHVTRLPSQHSHIPGQTPTAVSISIKSVRTAFTGSDT